MGDHQSKWVASKSGCIRELWVLLTDTALMDKVEETLTLGCHACIYTPSHKRARTHVKHAYRNRHIAYLEMEKEKKS